MFNSKKRKNSLSEDKVFVLYKDNPFPARVVAVEKRGRKYYLLIKWVNLGGEFKPEKWVREVLCKEINPKDRKILYEEIYEEEDEMSWWQKLIVKFKNWWYGED